MNKSSLCAVSYRSQCSWMKLQEEGFGCGDDNRHDEGTELGGTPSLLTIDMIGDRYTTCDDIQLSFCNMYYSSTFSLFRNSMSTFLVSSVSFGWESVFHFKSCFTDLAPLLSTAPGFTGDSQCKGTNFHTRRNLWSSDLAAMVLKARRMVAKLWISLNPIADSLGAIDARVNRSQ